MYEEEKQAKKRRKIGLLFDFELNYHATLTTSGHTIATMVA